MSFLHPLVLLGLAAGAIPALLHLLARHEPPEVEFPALRYLSEAERRSAHRLRLRHLFLLALRTALVLLIVLAAAHPLVPIAAGGLHSPTALVVILDNSPAASVVVDGRPVFDRLRAAARASLAAARPGDHLWLMLADGVARAGPRAALLAILDSLGVVPWRLDLSAAVTQAVQVIRSDPLPTREVHVVSALERTALGNARVAPGARVLVLAAADAPIPNRGVGRVGVTDGQLALTLVGTPGTEPGAVTVRLGSAVVGHALGGPGTTLSVPLPPEPPGWWQGDVTLDPDDFRADDRAVYVWHVARPSRVVASEAGPFVMAALGVLGGHGVGGPAVRLGGMPGSGPSVVLPPADRSLLGELNRALGARGSPWRYGAPGSPGLLASRTLPELGGVAVAQRYRLASLGDGADSTVVATVNGEPWLVQDGDLVLVASRLDTEWTELPRRAVFVPFVEALVNGLVRGEAPVAWREGRPRVEFRVHGTDTVGATVYGLDPRESDLTPATADEAGRALDAVVLSARQFAAAGFSGGRRADASGWLLGLALLVAATELGVATLTR